MRKKLRRSVALMLGMLGVVVLLGGTLRQPVSWAQESATLSPTATLDEPPTSPPPTVAVNRIWGYRVDNVFPAALRFFVGLNAARDEVAALSLSVRQASGLETTFTVDLDAAWLEELSTEASTQFLFEWKLDEPPVPVPFEPLEYTWQAQTTDGALSTVTASLVFEDGWHGKWQSAGSVPLTLHWLNPSLAGKKLRADLMRTYELLQTHLGELPSFIFAIYDPQTAFCQQVRDEESGETASVVISRDDEKIFPCSRDDFVRLYEMADVIFVERPTFGYTALQDLLVREVVQRSYTAYWGEADVPQWFALGLAQLYQQHPNLDLLEIARSAARTDALYTLERLAQALPAEASYAERRLWEAESYLLALYLADRYGADAPFTLAQSIPEQGSFEAALRALTETDAATLWVEWQRWLFSDAATRAAAWTPYLETTPTLTNTPSATPLPPTRTPTNTPSPSPTPTFSGNAAPTAVVVQLSPTARPSATNTPLPPGSLPTVTPRPTRAPVPTEGTSATSVPFGALAAAAIVAVLGLLGLWWSLRRRTRRR